MKKHYIEQSDCKSNLDIAPTDDGLAITVYEEVKPGYFDTAEITLDKLQAKALCDYLFTWLGLYGD